MSNILGNRAFRYTPMSLDQLVKLVPSIKNGIPGPQTSVSFRAVKTIDIVEKMMAENWVPVWGYQTKTRDPFFQRWAKHLVVLQHPSSEAMYRVGGLIPQIGLSNGALGNTSFSFSIMGLVLRCTNGMSAPFSVLGRSAKSHRFLDATDLMDNLAELSALFPKFVELKGLYESITVDNNQMLVFARNAGLARWADFDNRYRPDQLLQDIFATSDHQSLLKRKSVNLWEVMNTIQNRVIDGGLTPSDQNIYRSSRPVSEPRMSVMLNQYIWGYADALAKQSMGYKNEPITIDIDEEGNDNE